MWMLRWIRNWWTSDRIRFTPGHSRLFQLTVGSRVLVRSRLWTVLDRLEIIAEGQVRVQFRLVEFDESEPDSATLRIDLANAETPCQSVTWSEPGWSDTLFEEEIVQVSTCPETRKATTGSSGA